MCWVRLYACDYTDYRLCADVMMDKTLQIRNHILYNELGGLINIDVVIGVCGSVLFMPSAGRPFQLGPTFKIGHRR